MKYIKTYESEIIYKFNVGDIVRLTDEAKLAWKNTTWKDHWFRVIKQGNYGDKWLNNNIYYNLFDIDANEMANSKYEDALELVPTIDISAKKYNL